jgi:hypothetical protein
MANSIKKMNKALYGAAFHLNEAGKYLTNVEDFRPDAVKLFRMAEEMIGIVKPEVSKVTEEKMFSILDEIMEFSKEEKTK